MKDPERDIYYLGFLIFLVIPFYVTFISFTGLYIIILPGFVLAIILDKPSSKPINESTDKSKRFPERKYEYYDLSWLENQYYNLGKTLQDIADDQNVSMIEIRKYLDKVNENRVFN